MTPIVAFAAAHDSGLPPKVEIVSFAPSDPWEHKRRFEGEIRGFTVWSEALSDDALKSLNEAQAAKQ